MTETSTVDIQMPQEQPTVTQQSGISLGKGIAIVLVCATLFAAAGIGVGKLFFWNNYSKDTKLDHDLKQNQEKVQNDPQNPLNHISLGWSYFLKGENERAIGEYKKSLSLDPKSYAANYDMGLAYMSMKQYDRAIANFKDAITIVPNTSPAHLNLGISYYKTDRLEEALKELSIAYKYNPGSPESMYWRGMVYEKQNNLEDALQAYEDAISYAPKFQEAKDALERVKKAQKK
jgi:tetratricopeptide (TPR) repeat protein